MMYFGSNLQHLNEIILYINQVEYNYRSSKPHKLKLIGLGRYGKIQGT